MRAIQINNYGNPVDSVEVVNLPEPAAPGAGEVLIGVEYSPINPADLLLIMGYYAVRPALPAVAGNEGVGTIIAVGPGVTHVKAGDRVATPLTSFTWRERMVVPAARLVALPQDADPKQLSMLTVNPVTAQLLLGFAELNAGDWLVQNAGNSGVGRSVIAFARERGIKTINIVRREELVAELKAAGGDVVLVEGDDIAARVRAAIGDGKVKLGFDGVAGPATGVVASILDPAATLVCYGAMSNGAAVINPADVVFKQLKINGFFLGSPEHAVKFPALVRAGGELIAAGKLNVPVAAVYPLEAVKDALVHAQRGGKVLLDIAGK